MPSPLPAAVTLLALLLYFSVSLRCAILRGRHKIVAPATAGHPEYERAFRVQQNTLEQLAFFLPSFWLCALFLSPLWASVLGLVWVIGRVIYALAYWRNAAQRGPGFNIALIASMLLFAGAAAGVGMAMLHTGLLAG